jgi:hypothetical protein
MNLLNGKSLSLMSTGLCALLTLSATTASFAAAPSNTIQIVKKKQLKKKSLARSAKKSKRRADRLSSGQSSAMTAANATTSLPSLTAGGLTAGASTAEAPRNVVAKKRFVDGIRASALFEYYGASVADPLSGRQTDKSTGYGQSATPHELDTRLTLGYALNDNLTASYNAYFFSHGDTIGDNDAENFRFRAADSFVRLAVGKFYQSGKFRWNGDFRLYPALGSDRPGRLAYYRTGQNFMYSVTSRLTLAAYTSFRYYHNNDSAYSLENDPKGNKLDARFTFGPAVEYQILDTVGIALSFNDEWAHSHRNNSIMETAILTGVADYGSYFELGASIDASKRININPYLDMFTNAANIDAVQLGANLNFTIL